MNLMNFKKRKMNGMLKRTSMLCLSLAMIMMTACNDDNDDSNISPSEGPLYGFLVAVQDPDGRVNYVHTTGELGPDVKFDPSTSLEIPGFARFWAKEQTEEFFVGQDSDLTITKWGITEDGGFEEKQTVSLQGEGTTNIYFTMAIASDTKAYYIDFSQGQLIVLDLEGMVIDKVIPLPQEMAPMVGDLWTDFYSGEYHIVNDHLFIPVGWTDYDTKVKHATGLAVVNVNTDEITYVEDDRAPGAITVVKNDNEDLYFGTAWSMVYDAEGRQLDRKGGILRVRAGETTFDPDYFQPYPEVMADMFKSPINNKVYVRVLDESKLKWSEVQDPNETFDNVWQVALLDVITGEMDIVETLPHVQWFSTLKMDGREFIESQEAIENEPYNNRIVKLQEIGPDGKSFSQIYGCDGCRFIQNVARLR
ncbi:MAG: hypothetical protein ACLFOZ_15650 [Cyclobacteriaceae bacterium]